MALGQLRIDTGGSLKLEKCFWYILDYECIDGVWEPMVLVDGKLTTPVNSGVSCQIKILSPCKSKEALGLEKCPAGWNNDIRRYQNQIE